MPLIPPADGSCIWISSLEDIVLQKLIREQGSKSKKQ
jgi:hypothetical protein